MTRIDQKNKTPTTKKEVSGRLFERVFLPWTAILILSHLVTMYIAPAHTWGLHFYHFFPAWIGWVLSLASLVVLIPRVSESLYGKLEAIAEGIRRPFAGWGKNKTFLTLSIFSLPIFWIFRTRLYLLGDGYFRITDLPTGELRLQELLDGLVHLVIYRVMSKLLSSWTPELTYSIVSILCGGMFVFIALKLSSLLGKTGFGKVLIFFSLSTLGSIQLFFGYVESYTILQVALLAYVFYAALYLSGRVSILPALLTLVVSVGLHITSLIFAPSFIYLLWRGRRVSREEETSAGPDRASTSRASGRRQKGQSAKKRRSGKTTSTALILEALIVALIAVACWIYIVASSLQETGKGIFILPLVATQSYSFGMFSLAHVSEFINQLLLLSPLGISLIFFFLFFKIKFKRFEDRFANFLILAACFGLLYLFVFNFTLGSADWDLRSSSAPLFGLLGVYLFLTWGEKRSAASREDTAESKGEEPESGDGSAVGPFRSKRLKAWGLIFIWVGLFHTVPWVLINAHHQRSLNRYLLVQENDPHPVDETGFNLYKIARILRLADMPEEEEKLYLRAIDRDPYDTLSYFNLAAYYHTADRYDRAILVLDSLLRVDPSYPKANWMIGNIYVKRLEYEKALPYLEQVSGVLADNSDFLYDLGASYYSTDQPEKALTCGLQILQLTPDYTDAYHILGLSYYTLGDYDKAIGAWEHILSVNPDDSVAMQNLRELTEYLEKKTQ